MDVLDEVQRLLEAKEGSEEVVSRRMTHIKWLWACIGFMMTTGVCWLVAGTLWYSKMERTARAVEMIYTKVYGSPMP